MPAVPYDSGGLQASAVADVNRDGNLDLLVANQCVGASVCNSGTVGVLLGNGDGTFQSAVSYASGGSFAFSITVADVNGDGKPDVLVVNTQASSGADGSVGVLLGNGDGTFHAAVSYDSGGPFASSLAVGDVNGDGKPDVIVLNSNLLSASGSSTVGVLLNKGDGTFQTAVTYDSGDIQTYSVVLADVNDDGKPDLLVFNPAANTFAVLLGNGGGTFQTAASHSTPGFMPNSAAVADVNGDGKLDLVLAGSCANSTCNGAVDVMFGNGDGTFQTGATYNSGGAIAYSVVVGDVNADGIPDLLVANSCGDNSFPCATNGSVGVLLGSVAALSRP